jgi:GNAT superfamily N-acetyltransferase
MEIREVDVHNRAEFDAFYTLMREVHLHGREGMPVWSHAEATSLFTVPEDFETMTGYGAFDGSELVATGIAFFTEMDNLDKGFVTASVPPRHRRQGVGRAVIEHLAGVCHERGRTTLLGETWVPFGSGDDHPHRAFAAAMGFAVANVEVARELRLPVAAEQLNAWAAEAAEHHRDYTVETFVGPTPDDLIEPFCDLVNQLGVDAPTGDTEFEPGAMTPETLRQREKKHDDAGMTVFTTVALDAHRIPVAWSTISASATDPVNVSQWGTLVRREHRGHRLGLAVKAKNLRDVQAAFPERRRVITTNAEQNGPMLAINERLGFRPVELLLSLQRKDDRADHLA